MQRRTCIFRPTHSRLYHILHQHAALVEIYAVLHHHYIKGLYGL